MRTAAVLLVLALSSCRQPAEALAQQAEMAVHTLNSPVQAEPEPDPSLPAAGLADTGIFSDLDADISYGLPAFVDGDCISLRHDPDRSMLHCLCDGVAVKTYPLEATVTTAEELMGSSVLREGDRAELSKIVSKDTPLVSSAIETGDDADADGIPDQVDILLGALKTALNKASYDGGYQKISYPLGDVDRDRGCCTDVVIRALRNAGIDLQQRMHDDIVKRPKAYPHIDKPNSNIDHRRVRNMLVYMDRHLTTLPIDTDDPSLWMPGDIVLLDTLPKKGPDHVGIVSWISDEDGLPLVINNWTTGHTTAHMDLLAWCPVTHHFRLR